MVETLDQTHTLLSYVRGSLMNAVISYDGKKEQGFVFSLLNPPVPLGGNIVSLDIQVDEIPVQRKSILISTSEEVVNAGVLSDRKPIPFKPFQGARFLVLYGSWLEDKRKHKIVIRSRLEGFEDITIPFTFSDYVLESGKKQIHIPSFADSLFPDPSVSYDVEFTNFTAPLTLSGKKAYIVCSSNGSLSAKWTWMGVSYDNGGLYVPPTRAFGRIVVEMSMDDGVRKRLPNFVTSSRHEYGMLSTRHDLAGLQVNRRLAVPFQNRGFIMSIEIGFPDKANLSRTRQRKLGKRKVRLHFMIDGNITSYGLAAISQSNISKFNTKENCLQLSSSGSTETEKVQYFGTIGIAPSELAPSKVLTDSFDNDIELSYDLEIHPDKSVTLVLVGAGSFSNAKDCLKEFMYMRENHARLLSETEDIFKKYSLSTTTIKSSSQKPNINISKILMAYEKAKNALQYLKAEYDGLGVGICAGLPRFPNYWARDTGWSLRGYLSLGDYQFSRAVIDNFLRHQARNTSNGAFAGELPMIISGKAFLHDTTYGSADSTFLFPWAIRQYVLATADLKYLQERWDSIVALIDCGDLKDIDGDGLVDHGFTGKAEKLPIRDSTWMDHIDRRKSANDVQALFYESLISGSQLAKVVGDSYNKKKWAKRAEKLQSIVNREYWNKETRFCFDTIKKDGSKDPSIRPNALVFLLTGAINDPERAVSVLRRLEGDDMTTLWGVRTLSALDPKYQPALYHDGAVWPLVTGWMALGEMRFGRYENAFKYIHSMAERIIAENGMFAETYRGDRAEPFNSCILQAWSVGMFVHAVSEMMMGMDADMTENRIQLNPKLPESTEKDPFILTHYINAKNCRGLIETAVDSYNKKITIDLKGWIGRRPDFTSNDYAIDIK